MIVPAYWEPVMGGAQYQAKVLLERMAQRGGVDIHYLARNLPDNAKPRNHSLHRIGKSKGMYFIKDALTLLNKLQFLKPDAVYVHVGCAYLGVAAYYCRDRPCRLVWHLASDIDVQPWSLRQRPNPIVSFIDKKIIEYGMRRAKAIVAQTDHQTALLKKHYGLDATAVIKNFHPKSDDPIAKKSPATVLWIANLKAVKQPEIFQQAAAKLTHLDASFVMLGAMQLADEKRDALLATIEETPNLTWAGVKTQDEVNAALAASDLLVNTSVYEGFSNTFIQAWARKVPVISLSVDPDKLLSEGGLGACANGDFSRLCEQIATFLGDKPLRSSVAEKAMVYAETHHGMGAADQLIELLLESD